MVNWKIAYDNVIELESQQHYQSLEIFSDAVLELSPLRVVFLILLAEPLELFHRKM